MTVQVCCFLYINREWTECVLGTVAQSHGGLDVRVGQAALPSCLFLKDVFLFSLPYPLGGQCLQTKN